MSVKPYAPTVKQAPVQRLYTTTVSQARVQLFQPTRRPLECTRQIATPWGSGTITGKLGQTHADYVEAVHYNALDWKSIPGGGLAVLVDPHHVRRCMSKGEKFSGEQVKAITGDLMRALVHLTIAIPHGPALNFRGALVSSIADSLERRPNPLEKGADRPLNIVTFSPAYASLLDVDLPLDYDPRPFSRLRSGVAAAVARHIYTHRSEPMGGWKLDTLIAAVGAACSNGAIRERRSELREEAAVAALATLGVYVRGDRVFFEKRGASAPARGLSAPLRGVSAPLVEHPPPDGRIVQALQA